MSGKLIKNVNRPIGYNAKLSVNFEKSTLLCYRGMQIALHLVPSSKTFPKP